MFPTPFLQVFHLLPPDDSINIFPPILNGGAVKARHTHKKITMKKYAREEGGEGGSNILLSVFQL